MTRFGFSLACTKSLRAAPLLLLASLAACGGTPLLPGSQSAPEVDRSAVEFRQERFAAVSAQAAFEACYAEGLAMDRSARASANSGQYRQAARIFEGCLTEATDTISQEQRMRILALAIQGHAKAGDVARARELLDTFKSQHAGRELYYPDGTAFSEAMAMVLGISGGSDAGVFSTANVNPVLKSEVRRQRYWATN